MPVRPSPPGAQQPRCLVLVPPASSDASNRMDRHSSWWCQFRPGNPEPSRREFPSRDRNQRERFEGGWPRPREDLTQRPRLGVTAREQQHPGTLPGLRPRPASRRCPRAGATAGPELRAAAPRSPAPLVFSRDVSPRWFPHRPRVRVRADSLGSEFSSREKWSRTWPVGHSQVLVACNRGHTVTVTTERAH